MADNLSVLEERLGWHFQDRQLLVRALVTPACHMDRPDIADNQRLEFLGDAVFGLLAADILFARCPADQEGSLTVRRTKLVSGAALAGAAERLALRDFLEINRGAKAIPAHAKMLADAMEAVMGAVWLDGGFEAARLVFARLDLPIKEAVDEWSENPKGLLQVRAQALKTHERPVYAVLRQTGPAHAPVATVRVSVRGIGSAEATAVSVRAAEIAAARALLAKFR